VGRSASLQSSSPHRVSDRRRLARLKCPRGSNRGIRPDGRKRDDSITRASVFSGEHSGARTFWRKGPLTRQVPALWGQAFRLPLSAVGQGEKTSGLPTRSTPEARPGLNAGMNGTWHSPGSVLSRWLNARYGRSTHRARKSQRQARKIRKIHHGVTTPVGEDRVVIPFGMGPLSPFP
jgi:hypothetical protein